MDEKKPIKTVTLLVAGQFMVFLAHEEPKHDWLFFHQPHTHQDGPPGNREAGKIEMGATVTSYSSLSGLRIEDILRGFVRK